MPFLGFFYGLFIGSFLNVLVDRSERGESYVKGRSKCDSCGKILAWYELIPLVSFITQQGRCRNCGVLLSWSYPLSEILTGFVGMYLVATYGHDMSLLLGASLVSIGLLITLFADYKYQIVPDIGILIGVCGAVVFNGQLSGLSSLPHYGLTGLINALFILLIVLVTRGRGMGLGDVTLAFFMGIFLGFPLTLFAMYIAFLTGAGVGVILIMTRRKSLKSAIAFGPFLVAGTILSVIWQTGLITYWNNLW